VFKNYGTDVEIMFADEDTAPQDELVKDLITIITSFAGGLYRLRSHKTKRLIQTVKEVVRSPPQ
jgi:predicted site-specific integrase-resolvase